jgi:type I restriction enzyme S subunit
MNGRPHWSKIDVKPLKRVATIRSSNVDKIVTEGEHSVRLCNYVDVYYNERITDQISFSAGSAGANEIKKFALRPGDVIITKDSETADDIAVPALVEPSAEGVVCGYHLAMLRPDRAVMRGDFLFWCLKARPIKDEFSIRAQGITRFGLTLDGIGSVPLPSPNLDTQKVIATFLDRETARIDQLIEKKERQVEVLEEHRQALVTHLIFGQHLSVKFTEHDISWMPALPDGWPIERVARSFINLDRHRVPLNSEERADLEKLYPYYGASGIIDHIDRFIFNEDLILVGEDGANLIAQSTPIAFIARGKYWVNNHAHIIQPKHGPLEFWVHMLNQVPYEVFVTGSAQPKLTAQALGNIPLPIPPVSVQMQIANEIERSSAPIMGVEMHVQMSVDRLRELRSALITAAVTGQIDVASWGKRGETDRRLDAIQESRA